MTQHPTAPAVVSDIALHCGDELGRPMSFMATFTYDPADPYAVGVTFHVPAGEVPWLVSRTLLTRGLWEPAGEGDVRLRPAVDAECHAVVEVDFRSPEGRLRVEVRTVELLAFLEESWAAVLPGSEEVDVDRLADALLGRVRG